MARRLYFFLVLVRLYFALTPSYIHPDEHFQGPEIITGEVFGWPVYKTWEFTSEHPIRSIFPLWLVYGPPLTVLRWLCDGMGYPVTPRLVFYALRTLMFLLSFVLEDWALHELIHDKRERATALLLVASSYVTWTYQMHTFSNSIETIIVLWCLVLVRRMMADQERTQAKLCVALAFLGVLGVLNRITFPAWLLVPAVQLLPHVIKKRWRLPILLLTAGVTSLIAVAMDTEHYTGHRLRLRQIASSAVITPLNNLIYNLDSANLAQHGTHPFWQHFAVNLPQLVGSAYLLSFTASRRDTLLWCAITGTAILSCFSHQEARFLLPAVPLLLSSISLPKRYTRVFIATWIAFNALAAVVFGIYHQGGVVPVQAWIAKQQDVSHVLWWKTYSPPRWLLGEANQHINTTDLMGMPGLRMIDGVIALAPCLSDQQQGKTLLVAPASATFLDAYTSSTKHEEERPAVFKQVYLYRDHVGLDDLDWGVEGIWPTLQRVVGRRGLALWDVYNTC